MPNIVFKCTVALVFKCVYFGIFSIVFKAIWQQHSFDSQYCRTGQSW